MNTREGWKPRAGAKKGVSNTIIAKKKWRNKSWAWKESEPKEAATSHPVAKPMCSRKKKRCFINASDLGIRGATTSGEGTGVRKRDTGRWRRRKKDGGGGRSKGGLSRRRRRCPQGTGVGDAAAVAAGTAAAAEPRRRGGNRCAGWAAAANTSHRCRCCRCCCCYRRHRESDAAEVMDAREGERDRRRYKKKGTSSISRWV